MSVTRKAAMFPDSLPEQTDDSQYLPHYTYVSGLTTHPHRSGNSLPESTGNHSPSEQGLPPDAASQTPIWKNGARLFQHGYYWEAHEAWEGDWIVLGRRGPLADFTKALIKLAACGVKCLEQKPVGAKRHALRSLQLLQKLSDIAASELPDNLPGLTFREELEVHVRTIASNPPIATEQQRQQARHGGVPVLGQLPLSF
ncbi:DUF309 domain-containing protein [Planctomicrobium sp. SH527]|uniref:DUF309 domain-containing protein n=1 Tax=Planctomicrobium sp. SH527 TaxID=3448123 RepID=UPI003F5C63D5